MSGQSLIVPPYPVPAQIAAQTRNAFCWPIRVYYEDTDAGGVVFYANYVKFFERARTEWLRSIGVGQRELASSEGVVFIVKNTMVDYHFPARLDDELTLTVVIEKLGAASVRFAQEAWRLDEGQPRLIAASRVKIGCVEAESLRPVPIPDSVLAKLEGRP